MLKYQMLIDDKSKYKISLEETTFGIMTTIYGMLQKEVLRRKGLK